MSNVDGNFYHVQATSMMFLGLTMTSAAQYVKRLPLKAYIRGSVQSLRQPNWRVSGHPLSAFELGAISHYRKYLRLYYRKYLR